MNALDELLNQYRQLSLTEREKGTYFEELCIQYFKNEPFYADLYSDIWMYADWAANQDGFNKKDTGIDLVAKTHINGEFHAIQCKLYSADHKLMKSDIDSFFTASGKRLFTNRIIISTTNLWSDNALDALIDQNPPVTKINLSDLEVSQIDWARYKSEQNIVLKPKKTLREHQKSALFGVETGLAEADRGKLIMACGTGKTFTSLKIAEKLAGKGKRVLFLVPSLSLLSQTLTEWTQESTIPLHSFAVCSDSDIGKKRSKNKQDEDRVQILTHELRYPATTNPDRLAIAVANRTDDTHMNVIFSTYQSIDVISRAQKEWGMKEFDLIICDEAHRTTGATFITDNDESNFVKVHDQNFIQSKKRLYMTATPRIYGGDAKITAIKENAALCSMDDKALYGDDLYVINFSEAVSRGLLVDYKVIVLAVDEAHIEKRLQDLLADDNNQLKIDDAAKIIGSWKALAKQGIQEGLVGDALPMQRAVAFCQVIEPNTSKKSTTHKVSSKHITHMFADVVEAYKASEIESNPDFAHDIAYHLNCELSHVDGSMNAGQKEAKLNWLKDDINQDNLSQNIADQKTCRILSNVRCLSEGVDVPALDAVLFLTPRNSQVDVVQSVGRVMRNSPNKKRGYVILPVVIPAGVAAETALSDNKTYKVVWDVLQALRSHDDHFDSMINKMEFNGSDKSKMEVIAISDKITPRMSSGQKENIKKLKKHNAGKGSFGIGEQEGSVNFGMEESHQYDLQFDIGVIEKAIYAKIVEKCGNRHHWEDWANDIAIIARRHILRISNILDNPKNVDEIKVFNEFAHELRDDLNANLSDAEIIEMLAQHLITKPVFEALFEDYSFAKHNPMSQAMQLVLDILEDHHIDKEADTLQRFYDSVKIRAEKIDNAQGKQKIVVELYDKFFRNAFPRMTERLGIVYTPVEVVDFIIHSVNDVLKSEFNQDLGSENVHIIDPFTGTGTFITRLLQSGLIAPDKLEYKYKNEIHANEIVLLAYYIAAINIESVYHDLMKNPSSPTLLPKGEGSLKEERSLEEYVPFNGICLTDTFAMYENEDLVDQILIDNSKRRKRQKELDIRVIIGNPPYSAGQKSENDDNQNINYPVLDAKIRETYAANSTATLQKNLYDSYIRAIRWASDRIKDAGVIGFVSNASFVDSNSMDGLRKSLVNEFSSLYIFHLRGNQRTSGELSRKEGGKIFGSGSRAPIAISLLVKNPKANEFGKIYFHDIGDYLTQTEKLEKISDFVSIQGIADAGAWQNLTPDTHGDWINQRDDSFGEFISLGDKKDKNTISIFENYSQALLTSRDAWCYNFSKSKLTSNIQRMINFYNSEVERYQSACNGLTKENYPDISEFINSDSTKISWSRAIKNDVARQITKEFNSDSVVSSLYRPFSKQWSYFNKETNEMLYQMPKIFPNANAENLAICVIGRGATKDFCGFMTNTLPDYEMISKGQCFPLKLYELAENPSSPTLLPKGEGSKQEGSEQEGSEKEGTQNLLLFPSPLGRGARGEGLEGNSGTFKYSKLPENLLTFARDMRKNATDAEKLMWALLRGKQLNNTKFRRQHVLEKYILDFYCPEAKLALELDGNQHLDNQEYDEIRTQFLESQGIKVLRFWNHEILNQTESVLESIWNEIPSSPTLLPKGEGSEKEGTQNLLLFPSPLGRGARGEGFREESTDGYTVKDGISDAGLAHFQKAYLNEKSTKEISKEDLFYYIYGLLHCEEYKSKFADNLSKELPRIPAVRQAKDFWAFSDAGRKLADLHVNYESVAKYAVEFDCADKSINTLEDKDFRVTQMKFVKKGDKSQIAYNARITLKNIPLEAYEYVVNGKPAIEWVMERQAVTTHKDSQITNDANDWAIETMNNAKYPLELLQRVITVSLETMKIVKSLPKLEI